MKKLTTFASAIALTALLAGCSGGSVVEQAAAKDEDVAFVYKNLLIALDNGSITDTCHGKPIDINEAPEVTIDTSVEPVKSTYEDSTYSSTTVKFAINEDTQPYKTIELQFERDEDGQRCIAGTGGMN